MSTFFVVSFKKEVMSWGDQKAEGTENLSYRAVAKEEGIPQGTLWNWIRRYREGGEDALNPEKLHPGNRFSALHVSKSLSEEERLKLIIEKLQIENERLKKGYIVTLKDGNTRSSTF